MISKGRDVSSLFPNVVKNVVCANLQVKRLVYLYLTHYAEFEQDLALLSISTFQKDLNDPSPLRPTPPLFLELTGSSLQSGPCAEGKACRLY